MKEEKWGFHLVVAWPSETSMPLSSVANRDPLYQSSSIRSGRTSTNVGTNVGSLSVRLDHDECNCELELSRA